MTLNDTVIHSSNTATPAVFDKPYHQMNRLVVSGCINPVGRNYWQGKFLGECKRTALTFPRICCYFFKFIFGEQ